MGTLFEPADGETARWRRVDEFIDARKNPGEFISFKEIQDLLGVDKATAVGVVHQVREKREKAGKRTLVAIRGAGWVLARADQELEEDRRRHEHVVRAVESRVRLLGSVQGRRGELSPEEQRSLDFRAAQAAGLAAVVGSRKISASDILGTGGGQHVPITARETLDGGESRLSPVMPPGPGEMGNSTE